MKIKTSIIILLVVLSINHVSSAQTKIQLSGGITFSMPTGTTKYYDEKLFKFWEEAFSKKFAEVWYKRLEVYKSNEVIYRFTSPKSNENKKKQENYNTYMSKVSKSWEDTYHKPSNASLYKNYSKEVKTMNNNEILIASYQGPNEGLTYQFVCFSPSKKKSLRCEVVGKLNDKIDIVKTLDDIFKSIAFN